MASRPHNSDFVDPSEVEEIVGPWVAATGLGEPFLSRETPYGVQHLMQDSHRVVVWREMIEIGKQTKIHRHETACEIICVTGGRLLVNEFEEDGEPASERLLISGDVYKVPRLRWHKLTGIGTTEVIELWFPADSTWNVSSHDVEEWKPARVIGRG